MGDGAVQIRSKDDEDFNQFCLAENKTVPFKCSEISALLTIPELPTLPKIKSCELTTELVTTELTTFTTEETGKVSVSSPQRTSTGASDPTVSTLTKDSEDKSTNPTTVDGGTLTDTVTSSQQSTSNLDLLSSTTTTPRNEFIATPPSSSQSGSTKVYSGSTTIQSLGSTTDKSGSTTGKNEVMITDRGFSSSGTSPGLSGTGEGLSISLDGPYTSSTEPVELEFITGISTEVETDPTTIATTPLTKEMFSEQERGLSNGPVRETETPTMSGVTFGPTTGEIENPNAALIIGLTSLGVLFLIVAAVILFYKFYYKPKKSRSLTVTPTSGGSPQEVNGPLRFHDPDKRFLELHPANSLQAGDGKNETKEPHISANDIDGKNSPSVLPPVASSKQVGESDITQPKNKKKKKRKRKSPEAQVLPNVESPVIGNGTGEPKEVIT